MSPFRGFSISVLWQEEDLRIATSTVTCTGYATRRLISEREITICNHFKNLLKKILRKARRICPIKHGETSSCRLSNSFRMLQWDCCNLQLPVLILDFFHLVRQKVSDKNKRKALTKLSSVRCSLPALWAPTLFMAKGGNSGTCGREGTNEEQASSPLRAFPSKGSVVQQGSVTPFFFWGGGGGGGGAKISQ